MTQSPERVQSIDILRGAVMILMALDHVRDFVHSGAASFAPDDLSRTTAALFFTRWITHFCAPTFMLTAGIGAFYYGRHRTKAQLSRYLWTRGLWLVFLELTVMHFALSFRFSYQLVILNILWAIGMSMIALGVLVWLPVPAIAVLSLAMIALHNLTDKFNNPSWIWTILHQQGVLRLAGHILVVGYPLIPWIGVMALGYCFGNRREHLVRLGLAITLAFVVLRALNFYGDPAPWSVQTSALFNVLSFLRCAKYPPSLDFLLMTLGPAITALGLLDRVRVSNKNPFLIFGRVPLFYFIVHMYLAHIAAFALAYLRYGTPGLVNPPASLGDRQPIPAYGFDLWVVYAVWVGLVLAMYPLCRWFAGVKQRRHDWWLAYL